jgi:selenocysteine lyase/cysteine desulfurase
MTFAGYPADILFDPLRRRFNVQGFLSHLHSLMVTMSQKSSVPQAANSVSQALMSDKLDWRDIRNHEFRLTRRLLDGLASIAGARVLGPADTHDRRGVILFSIEGLSAAEICRHLDRHGVALRGGHHCAQPLIHAFGVEGLARASLAPYSLDRDVDALLDGLDELVGKRRKQLRFRNSISITRRKALQH